MQKINRPRFLSGGIAAFLAFGLCSCTGVRPSVPGSERSKPWDTFTGEAVSGETFVRTLPNGFRFQLDWNGDIGSIEIVDPAGSLKDLCAVATPPYHGPNALLLSSDDLLQTEEQERVSNRIGRKRYFHCLMTERDREEATWALFGRTNKAPFDKPATEGDRERAFQRYIVHAGERCLSGWIEIVDVKDVKPGSGKNSSPQIGRMRFLARFELPRVRGESR